MVNTVFWVLTWSIFVTCFQWDSKQNIPFERTEKMCHIQEPKLKVQQLISKQIKLLSDLNFVSNYDQMTQGYCLTAW